jgi:sulfhydrogenase subunit beta (sulfur reductase)
MRGTMIKAKINKYHLDSLFEALKGSYTVIGPKVEDGVIILAEMDIDDIPAGCKDRQAPGVYRIEDERSSEIFSFSVGPHSLKKFLSPSLQETFAFRKSKKGLSITPGMAEEKPIAFIGVRSCDLAALRLLDRVFLEGPVREPLYYKNRKDIFVIAVNCLYPNGNCFCDSMGTGPEATSGFDIAMTEFDEHFFIEIASVKGEKILHGLPIEETDDRDVEEKGGRIFRCKEMIRKSMKTADLPGVLYRNMDHPRWAEIAHRDLECGNCTMVCPTCFCNSSYDRMPISALSGDLTERTGMRIRAWDSCFSKNFARVHGGNFRPSGKARYRHWMAHKLAYWVDQFGSPGCVGCGRCITWCPVGIDITHELEELRIVR